MHAGEQMNILNIQKMIFTLLLTQYPLTELELTDNISPLDILGIRQRFVDFTILSTPQAI